MIKFRIYTIGYLILSTLLSVIRRLQKANETAQKCLADTHAQMKLMMLICQIKQCLQVHRHGRKTEVRLFVEIKRD